MITANPWLSRDPKATPSSTSRTEYCRAKAIARSCVLSPNSAKKMSSEALPSSLNIQVVPSGLMSLNFTKFKRSERVLSVKKSCLTGRSFQDTRGI